MGGALNCAGKAVVVRRSAWRGGGSHRQCRSPRNGHCWGHETQLQMAYWTLYDAERQLEMVVWSHASSNELAGRQR